MSKRLQIILSDESWQCVDALCKEANTGFELGHITYSDAIDELIINSKPDVRALQLKHTSVRKSLLLLSSKKGIDFDAAIKTLTELKSKTAKRSSRYQTDQAVTV